MSDNENPTDTENPKAFSGIKQTWHNPKARKGILLTAAVVGVVVVVTGLSLKSKSSGAPGVTNIAQLATPPVVNPDVTAAVTPAYQQMVRTKDNERANAAAKSDLDMALPQVAGLSQIKPDPIKPPVVVTTTTMASAPVAPAPAPVQNQAVAQLVSQSDMQAHAQAEQQIRSNPAYQVAGAFMTSAAQQFNSAARTPFAIIAAPQLVAKPAGSTGADGSGAAQGAAGAKPGSPGATPAAPPTPSTVLVGAGDALFATMDTAINSDYSGPVVATVRQGKYSGARVIGTKSLEYDAVVLKFNVMSLPSGGAAIPIQAYAINLGDITKFGTTGLEGTTDYHVIQRYVLPAILAFAQTYGYAASMSGSTSSTTATSTTQTTTPLSTKDRALVALGGAIAPVASDLAKRAARPITIQMNANTEVGILFTQDVTDKNAQAAADKSAQGINVGVSAAPASGSPTAPAPGGGYAPPVIAPRTNTGGFGGMQQQGPTYSAPYKPASGQ